jgi:hypothetical protein
MGRSAEKMGHAAEEEIEQEMVCSFRIDDEPQCAAERFSDGDYKIKGL